MACSKLTLDLQAPSAKPSFGCNILKLLKSYESGQRKNAQFKSDVTRLKAQQLKRSCEEFEIDPYLFNCKFLRSSHSGCIIGVWQKTIEANKKHSIVYHMKFEYSIKNQLDNCPVVSELSCCGPFDKRLDVTDSCEKTIQGRTSLLYVGNTAISSGRIVLNVNNTDSIIDYQPELMWYSCKRMFSCTNNIISGYFAAGTEKGCYLFDSINFVEIEHLPGDVLAVEFSKEGNLLYCGIENDALMSYDLREALWHIDDFTIGTRLGVKGVKEMKLLSDEVSVVATVLDGRMLKLDLRMRKPVFTYPSFCNQFERRSLSVDESLDLVCATGDNNYSKLWSLSSGELLKTIQPLHQKSNTHACLISDQRKWFLALVQDNILTPVLHCDFNM